MDSAAVTPVDSAAVTPVMESCCVRACEEGILGTVLVSTNGGAVVAVAERFIARVGADLDVRTRVDLRERLADQVEAAIVQLPVAGDFRLPPLRQLSVALGIHRNTVRAALELLVERGRIRRDARGRYLVTDGTTVSSRDTAIPHDGGLSPGDFSGLLKRAAQYAVRQGLTEAAFCRAAVVAFRAGQAGRRVALVGEAPCVGLDRRVLAERLGVDVEVDSVSEVLPGTVVLCFAGDVVAVRAAVGPHVEVLPVGAMLVVDVKLAVAQLPTGSIVGVVDPQAARAEAVCSIVERSGGERLVKVLAGLGPFSTDVTLVLAPTGADVGVPNVPVLYYRSGLSESEVEVIRTRLRHSASEVADTLEKAASNKGRASSHTSG